MPDYMLVTAKMDRYLRVSGTCFFLAVSKSYDEVVVREIHGLGNEVGYHYDNMDVASREYGRVAGVLDSPEGIIICSC